MNRLVKFGLPSSFGSVCELYTKVFLYGSFLNKPNGVRVFLGQRLAADDNLQHSHLLFGFGQAVEKNTTNTWPQNDEEGKEPGVPGFMGLCFQTKTSPLSHYREALFLVNRLGFHLEHTTLRSESHLDAHDRLQSEILTSRVRFQHTAPEQ